MHTFIIRRILALLPTLIFTSIIVFASIRLIPGDVIDLMLAQNDISTGNDRAVIEDRAGRERHRAGLAASADPERAERIDLEIA